ALVDELGDRELGEDLVERAQVELGVDSVRRLALPRGIAVRGLEEHGIALGEQYRARELAGAGERIEGCTPRSDRRGVRARSGRCRGPPFVPRIPALDSQASEGMRRSRLEEEGHVQHHSLRRARDDLEVVIARCYDANRSELPMLVAHVAVD